MKAETTIELSTGRRIDVLETVEDLEAWIGGQARLLKLTVVRNGKPKRLSLHSGVLISVESGAPPPPPPLALDQPLFQGMRYVTGAHNAVHAD